GPCATPLVTRTSCSNAFATGGGNGVPSSYQLFSLAGSYRFGEKYTLRLGIDNLLDEDPPMVNGNPLNQPYPIPATHFGTGFPPSTLAGTYDPLGRRGFVSFTMEFCSTRARSRVQTSLVRRRARARRLFFFGPARRAQ